MPCESTSDSATWGRPERHSGGLCRCGRRDSLIHFSRCFERQGLLGRMGRLAFFMDGPLGVFGPPAWLNAAISTELETTERNCPSGTGRKRSGHHRRGTRGNFVAHFDEIDRTENPGEKRFSPRSYMLLTDQYIKERITCSDSDKRYGQDTYFGRKFFYKTSGTAKIVGTIPFLTDEQDSLDHDDISLYPQFGMLCSLLDKLASSRYVNSVTPLIAAHVPCGRFPSTWAIKSAKSGDCPDGRPMSTRDATTKQVRERVSTLGPELFILRDVSHRVCRKSNSAIYLQGRCCR